jgi:hypothetical protein
MLKFLLVTMLLSVPQWTFPQAPTAPSPPMDVVPQSQMGAASVVLGQLIFRELGRSQADRSGYRRQERECTRHLRERA